jgi:hypothetical protein
VEQQRFVIDDKIRIEGKAAGDYVERRTNTIDAIRHFVHPGACLLIRSHICLVLGAEFSAVEPEPVTYCRAIGTERRTTLWTAARRLHIIIGMSFHEEAGLCQR